MVQYRQIQGKVDNEVAKAIRELYDFCATLKKRVDEQSKPTAPPAQQSSQPSLQSLGLSLKLGGPISILSGKGTPLNIIMGSPGDIYLNLDGGANTTLYIKESGINTTGGWVAK